MKRASLSILAIAAIVICGFRAPDLAAAEAPDGFRPAGRGGNLLPAGWLSTRGRQIIDTKGVGA